MLPQLHREFFLVLNGLHHPFLDPIMGFITGHSIWYPVLAVLLIWIGYRQRYAGLWTVGGMLIGFALSDRLTSGFMKPFFAVLRPCHEPLLDGQVYVLYDHCGGLYGFASSHAANAFAMTTLVWLSVARHENKRWPTIALFLFASLVSYSRIYAGVHYPADIVVGACVGTAIAYGIYYTGEGLKPLLRKKNA